MYRIPFEVIKFCCEEITRQRDTTMSVPDLVTAWNDALEVSEASGRVTCDVYDVLTTPMIERWGFLAKPHLNSKGFRRHNIQVADYIAPDWRDVPRLIERLVDHIHSGALTPAQAYYEYEMVHPFADGNGRTGKILYNFLLGSLLDPQMPPNFFGHDNP